jgi:hypothetical protein
MGVVIFLLICCVVVLLGLCIKWNSEKYSENGITEVKELSTNTEAIVIKPYRSFPKIIHIPSSNEYNKYTIQSILRLLLKVQTNPTKYKCSCVTDNFNDTSYICINDSTLDLQSETISIGILMLLKSINFVTINQVSTPAKPAIYDEYGFIICPQIQSESKIVIKVTEEGKKYLNS